MYKNHVTESNNCRLCNDKLENTDHNVAGCISVSSIVYI